MEQAVHAKPEMPAQDKNILKKLRGLKGFKELKGLGSRIRKQTDRR